MLQKYKPDWILVWETWLNKDLYITQPEYEWIQTKAARHQGAWIIIKRNCTKRIYKNNEPYIIAVKAQIKNRRIFLISAYFKENKKWQILDNVKEIIDGIRRAFKNPNIILYGDFNTDNSKFKISKIEKYLRLESKIDNKMITRRQDTIRGTRESTLDYILTNLPLIDFQILENVKWSDHLPIAINCKYSNIVTKARKTITIKKRVEPNIKRIRKLLSINNWPTNKVEGEEFIYYERRVIRPTVMKKEQYKVFENIKDWESKELELKTLANEQFREYMKGLDLALENDVKIFYKILNSLTKYRVKNYIAAGVTVRNEILLGEDMAKVVKGYYENLYAGSSFKIEITQDGIIPNLRLNEAIEESAVGKAVGLDGISAEWLKNRNWRKDIWNILNRHFKNYLIKGEIPNYFMKAKLVLISKDDSKYPTIDKTRPISILPAITKIFESSIKHHLEAIMNKDEIFDDYQRGFRKQRSTLENISEVLDIAVTMRNSREDKPHLVFFDLKRAYDTVPRDILIRKLIKYKISSWLVQIEQEMLQKFELVYGGKVIKTERGLVQGSWLSPVLFNLFINDLLKEFRDQEIEARGYADDIVCIWESKTQAIKAIEVMRKWTIGNGMEVNQSKSGIMRVLKRKGKWFVINNSLNIPEVDNYKYLGIRLDQTLRLDGYKEELKRKENYILKRVRILKPSLVSTKSKIMAFISVWKAQVSYGHDILSRRNQKYQDSWESIIYRILKGLFNIRVRVSKKALFKSLGFDDILIHESNKEDLKAFQNKFISRLTNKSIKFRVDALFRNFKRTPLWRWVSRIDNKHVVESWPKTERWREKWGRKIENISNLGINRFLWHNFKIERNFEKWANTINDAIEELTEWYFCTK